MGTHAHRAGGLSATVALQAQEFLATVLASLAAVPMPVWAAVLVALLLIRASSRLGMWPYALMAWPGTLAHELAHFSVAVLLRAQPSFPSLTPQRTAHGWRLGSVSFRAGWLRSGPIALAPIALLPLSAWWVVAWLQPASGAWFVLHAWLAAALLSASLPSSADFRIALPALLLIAAIAALALLALR